MRTHIPIRALVAALLTMSALAIAACGEDDGGGASGASSREQKGRDAALAFTKCMRENGVDMPDPYPNQGGIGLIVPRGTSREKAEAADKACRKHLEAIEPPDISPEQEKKFQQAALAQSRCMRKHGIDMPDPTFDDNGGAQMRIGPGSGIDPEDPKFQKAQEACRREAPGGLGGGTFEGTTESPNEDAP